MEDYLSLQLERQEANRAKRAATALQEAKLKALQDALGNYDNYKYVNFYDFLDPNNQYWNDYEYKLPGDWFEKQHGRIEMDSPVGWFINNIRNAKTIGNVYKQSELWNSFDPLSSRDNTRKYLMYMVGGSQPESPTTNKPNPSIKLNNNIQYVINTLKTYGYPQQVLDSFQQDIDKILANTKDTNRIDTANQYIDQFLGDKSLALQDLRRLDPAPGKPAPNQQPQKAGNKNEPGKKPRMSDAEIDAFLNEELGGGTTGNGTYASAGIPRGGVVSPATMAAAAHDKGVEDSNSIESSDDHFIDDDELYGLLKAMKDPHKANAVANYIYSKHGNESDVQNLGWRGWLNKYYGDLLRSRMGLDPSSYNGMHIS